MGNRNVLLVLLIFLGLSFCSARNDVESRKEFFNKIAKTQFNSFKLQFKKAYKSVDEEDMRFEIFRKNLKIIAKMNIESRGANNFGITQFSDLTPSEFSHLYLMPKRPTPEIDESKLLIKNYTGVNIPAEWDWRKDGLINGESCITHVYNQG